MATTLGNGNIIFGDSTTQATAFAGYGGSVYTAPGAFTIPTGVSSLKVTVVGGGGGGGNWAPPLNPGQGGGAGGIGISFLTGLTPGGTLAVTVGAGGAIATSGGTSSVSSGTQPISTISATGGGGGASGGGSTSSALGGSGSGATINLGAAVMSGGNLVTGAIGGFNSFNAKSGYGSLSVGSIGGTGGGGGGNPGGTGGAGGSGIVIFEW